MNNREIGERLFIARGTVKIHLSHVYAKLGVHNRAELAALATRHAGSTTSPLPAGGRPAPGQQAADIARPGGEGMTFAP